MLHCTFNKLDTMSSDYCWSNKTSNLDLEQEIIFADNVREAREKADCMDIADYAEGWIWFDRSDHPEPETTTDDEFFDWLVEEVDQ